MIDDNNDLELKGFIRQNYLRFLEREPDEDGLNYFFALIQEGKIKLEDLPSIFVKSEEHKKLILRIERIKKISKEFEDVLKKSGAFDKYLENTERKPEPTLVFVSCINPTTEDGGMYYIKDQFLVPIYVQRKISGMFYDKSHNILFGVANKEPQVVAFKNTDNNKFVEAPIHFSNYIFAENSHGMCIVKDKIYIVGADGSTKGKKATNAYADKDKVGNIIVSDLIIGDVITIKNSKAYNPFNCLHHHNINDICQCNGNLYLSSFSYCDGDNRFIEKGAISKLDENCQAQMILDTFEMPHTLYFFRNKLYVCSSANAIIFSIDLRDKSVRLEYKGINAFTRGLLVTDNYFYIGISFSIGRTDSKFTNPNYGILKFNINTGETRKINLPPGSDNVYAIISN